MPLKLPSFRARKDAYPPDLWTKCPSCGSMIFNKQLDKALRVCATCGHHFRLSAAARVTFSPTTAPIEPPMNPKSITQMAMGTPPITPVPQAAASRMPGAVWAAAIRSG